MNRFVKYFYVAILAFAIMEKTGVSLLTLVTDTKPITEFIIDEQMDEDARAANEIKESVKEYWVFEDTNKMPVLNLPYVPLTYANNEGNHHLAYFPSVPTPPPNQAV